jgi:hypothetical protein
LLDGRKPADRAFVDENILAKHGVRAYPEPTVSVKGLVDDYGLEGFAMPRNGNDLVVVALVVSVVACGQLRKGRKLGHRSTPGYAEPRSESA